MKGFWAAAALALILLLASWVWLHETNRETRAASGAEAALGDYTAAEADLRNDVLRARAGLLRNYDPINAGLAAMRRAVARLAATPTFAAEAAALAASIDEAETVIERFKSANALLQNSLASVALLSERIDAPEPELARRVGGLASAVLALTLDTSPVAVGRVDALVAAFPAEARPPPVAALLDHALLLRTLLPAADADVQALANTAASAAAAAARAAIAARQAALANRADAVRWLLYGLAAVLAALLVAVGARLRERVQALRTRAGIEHAVAKISMRFLNTPTWKMDAHLAVALAELSGAFGASRVTLVLAGTSLRTVGTDARPAGWAEAVVDLMGTAGRGDGCILHIEDVPQHGPFPAASGARSFLAIARTADDAVRAVLVLEDRRPRAFRRVAGTRLLTLAFNALTVALARSTLEEERARLEISLARAQRMETVGMFASGLAHNFNNIVGAVLGHAEMAASALPGDGRVAGHIRAIQIAGARASDLVDQLLTFGRRRDGVRDVVDVDTLVAEAVLLMQSMLDPSVRLEVAGRPGATVASAEPHGLVQVVLNLLRNAAQAIDAAGTIAVSVGAREMPEGWTAGDDVLPAGGYVVVAVEDDGRGMDAATLRSIFEPFFTTRESGNGLGLATAREIVRNHAGAIGVTSRPGAGTRFEILLPWVDGGAAPTRRGSGEAVLLLDGDDARRLRIEDALAALEYEPVGFADAGTAVAACRGAPARFDAALVCADDTAACDALHAAAPHLPIVLATNTSRASGADALARAGIAAVVPLPPPFALLADAVATALGDGPVPAAALPDGKDAMRARLVRPQGLEPWTP